VAAQALAVLGDVAVNSVHVRFYGVGPVSLCGGYFWRDGYWDFGIRDRKVADEKARGSLRSSIQS
jgi:hypothetical protein